MDIIQKGILILIKSAVSGKALKLPDGFSLDEAFTSIAEHRIISTAYTGAVNCGIPLSLPIMQKMLFYSAKLMMISEKQMQAVGKVTTIFSDNEIDHMPVKGCVMKTRYPSPELRYMGDADILIRKDQYDKISPLMKNLGFTLEEECDHVFVWKSQELLLELHVKLIPSSEHLLCEYLGDGWRLAKEKNGYCYAMTKEDEFIFSFIHFVKHYRDSGIGCRHVVDLWIMDRLFDENSRAYIKRELKKMRLDTFYKNMVCVIKNWFEDGESDVVTEHITQFIFSCGNWGQAKTQAMARQMLTADTDDPKKMGRKLLLKDIFPPSDRIKGEYPILEKVPFILPFVWIWRIIKTVIFKRDSVRRSLKRASLLNEQAVNDFRENLKIVGLEPNKKADPK